MPHMSIPVQRPLVRMALAVFFLSLSQPLLAQFSSSIEGTVLDQSGSAIAAAEVAVTNESTQLQLRGSTNETGFFRILNLPPGSYRVEVQASGFKTWLQTDLVLESNQVRPIYSNLIVGEQNTTIEVTATAGTVEIGKASVGRAIETKTIQEIPMVGRNIYAAVTTLAPGITGSGGLFGGAGGSGSQGTNSFQQEPGFQVNAAGQRQETNEYQVDGSSVNGNSRDGIVNLTPQADTIQEVKISAGTFSAEKGRNSGALVEAYTKSGTNQFHGTLSEFHTNNRLQARTVFQRSIPVFRRNEFGGTLGGPLVKERTFFFGSLFFLQSSQSVTQTVRLETPQFRDFLIRNFPDGMATRLMRQAASDTDPTTDLWTAARVRATNPSPLPTPTNIPDDLPVIGTAFVNLSPLLRAKQWNVRIDQNLNGYKDRIFYSSYRTTSDAETPASRVIYRNILPNSGLYQKLSWTHTVNPNLVNEVSFTYVRSEGDNPGALSGHELPNVNVTGLAGFNQWGPAGWVHNNYSYHEALSYIRGNHNIKVGVDIDRQQDLDNFTLGLTRPSFGFANILDFATDRPFSQGGIALDTRNGQVATNLYQRIHMLYTGGFVQDDWKVSRKLTINWGLRYDYFGRLATAANGNVPFSLFTPGEGSTFAAQVANGFMRARGDKGFITDNRVQGIAPRFGFGYDAFGNGSLALRGGYGLYYNRIGNLSFAAPSRSNAPEYATPTLTIQDTDPSRFTYAIGTPGFAPPRGVTFQIDSRGGIVGTRTGVAGLVADFDPPRTHN